MALSTWQFEQILRSYDQTRQRNHALHLKRQEDIYEKIPEIKEIDQKIASQSIQTGRKILFQEDKQALRDLRIENMELSMQKVELLVSHGYDPDYLNPIYDCPSIISQIFRPNFRKRISRHFPMNIMMMFPFIRISRHLGRISYRLLKNAWNLSRHFPPIPDRTSYF